MKKCLISCLCFFLFISASAIEGSLLLRDNLQNAQAGDYIVTAQGKNYCLLHIYDKAPGKLTIEEISIPSSKVPKHHFSWKNWAMEGAAGCTSHVLYSLDPSTGQMQNFFTQKQGRWYEVSPQGNFLSTLLNLQFQFVTPDQRRRVGITLSSNDRRPLWQPKMVVEGRTIEGIHFDAWKAAWPKDGSDLAGKMIEVYLPQANTGYPSYFPYWLQISGLVGNAKIRIVDSGRGLTSLHSIPYSTQNL